MVNFAEAVDLFVRSKQEERCKKILTWDDFVIAVGANISATCIYAPRKEGVFNEPSVSFDNDGQVWVSGSKGCVRLFKNCPPSLMYEMYIQRLNEY